MLSFKWQTQSIASITSIVSIASIQSINSIASINNDINNIQASTPPSGGSGRSGHPLMLVVFGILLGLFFAPNMHKRHSAPDKVGEALQLIESEYVDNMSRDSLEEQAVRAILSTLDPHSSYLSITDFEREESDMRGNFDGVGMVLRMVGDTVCVGQIIEGGPSSTHDILPGDRILRVDTTVVSGAKLKIEDVVAMLRGPRRSQVDVTFYRIADGTTHTETIRRGVIPTPSLSYYGMLKPGVGYIRLARFTETSYNEVCQALDSLNKQGLKHLVFDLRSNSGGLLEAATSIADEFLPARQPIVYTKGAHQRRQTVRSTRNGRYTEGKLTVVIDEWSASASEIVAGAIQDNDRGEIVGRRSFGKGLVQRQCYFKDGSAMFLTIARYYTPSGRCIQRPYSNGTKSYYSDFIDRVADEVLHDSVALAITDSTPYYTLRQHRTVYGGGGIYPDRNISYRKDTLAVYYNNLINKQVISTFSLDYVSRHAKELLDKYPTGNDFYFGFTVSDNLFEAMLQRADKEGIARNQRSIAAYGKEMRDYIKAYIAESLYGNNTFYRITLPYDYDIKIAANL